MIRKVLLLLAATTPLLAADWPWRDWQDHPHWENVERIPFLVPPYRPLDVAANLLLGAPIGLIAAKYFRRALLVAGTAALLAALLGEYSQIYSHSRTPSATDVASNLLGALTAALTLLWARSRRAESHTVAEPHGSSDSIG